MKLKPNPLQNMSSNKGELSIPIFLTSLNCAGKLPTMGKIITTKEM